MALQSNQHKGLQSDIMHLCYVKLRTERTTSTCCRPAGVISTPLSTKKIRNGPTSSVMEGRNKPQIIPQRTIQAEQILSPTSADVALIQSTSGQNLSESSCFSQFIQRLNLSTENHCTFSVCHLVFRSFSGLDETSQIMWTMCRQIQSSS